MSSQNTRILVSCFGALYQRSKTVISQSAYPAPSGGGAVQFACGSSRSIAGGPNRSSASYVVTGSLATLIVHRMPL